jgi:hypothetical protein
LRWVVEARKEKDVSWVVFAPRLDGLRKPDGVLAEVVDSVVLRDDNEGRRSESVAVEEGTTENED